MDRREQRIAGALQEAEPSGRQADDEERHIPRKAGGAGAGRREDCSPPPVRRLKEANRLERERRSGGYRSAEARAGRPSYRSSARHSSRIAPALATEQLLRSGATRARRPCQCRPGGADRRSLSRSGWRELDKSARGKAAPGLRRGRRHRHGPQPLRVFPPTQAPRVTKAFHERFGEDWPRSTTKPIDALRCGIQCKAGGETVTWSFDGYLDSSNGPSASRSPWPRPPDGAGQQMTDDGTSPVLEDATRATRSTRCTAHSAASCRTGGCRARHGGPGGKRHWRRAGFTEPQRPTS